MNNRIINQKDILTQLHHEASLLKQQLDFLIRNEKELRLLDLDVLMNRTHSIYEMLCSINLSNNDTNDEGESLDVMSLLGELINIDNDDIQGQTSSDEERIEDETSIGVEEQETSEVITTEPLVDNNEDNDENILSIELESTPDDTILTKEAVEEIVVTQDIESTIEEIKETEHTESHEVIGDVIAQRDNSLNNSIQNKPIKDIKEAIGINDKYLFVNELFAGSMEKYNRSIDTLNDLQTLDGALIYLNELKIELQWNSSNDAYKKLSSLVRRKYE